VRVALVALLALLVLLGTASTALTQESFRVSPGGAVFPDQTYVITLDRDRQLQTRDVTVTENGRRVPGAVVQSAASAGGVGTILLIDASNSMRGQPVEDAMTAARAFARRNPNQPLGIIAFNDRVQTLLQLTENQRAIDTALARTPGNREGTHIYDALAEAAKQLASRGIDVGRIVLLSDGQEVGSTVSRDVALERLRNTGIRVYTVGLKSKAFDAGYLEDLADETGGTFAEAASSEKLAGIYDKLGYRFSNEYLLRYRSPAGPGEEVNVEIAIGGVSQSIAYVTPRTGSGGPFEKSIWDRFIQSWLVIPIVVLTVLALAVYAISSVLNARSTHRFRARLSEFVDIDAEERARLRRREVAELLALGSERAARIEWQPLRGFAEDVDVGGMRTPPATLLAWTAVGTLLVAVLAGALIGPFWLLLGLVVPFVVRTEVKRRAQATRRLFGEQLPDNLEVMASSLRAGHSLAGGLATVVEEAQPPSREEFRRVATDEQLGVPLDDALEVAAKRMQNADMYQVAVVAMLGREAGGNVAGVLDQVIANVRARADLNRTVRVLTAQGRMARWIIALIPVVLMALIAVVSPSYLSPLFEESAGQVALVFAAVLVVLGFYVISRIAALEV
jgi:tight adherence protein B